MRFVLFLVLTLAACAPRGQITLDPSAAKVGDVRPVFVGTSRALEARGGSFGSGRSEQTRFAQVDVSIPPDRQPGRIEYPAPYQRPDPSRDFLTTAQILYQGPSAFRAALSRALSAKPAGQREVVVFVHGFNNTYAESIYRIAQIGHDFEVPGISVAYSWPSAANPLAYAYDRDSVLFARDGLEELLSQVARSGARRILLVGHSMGCELVVEVLRQMALDANRTVLARLSGVVLISPDVDVEVFRKDALRIGKLPQPFIIFTSGRDRALALSARLTGLRHRLGNLQNLQRLADLKVTVLDVGAFSKGVGHFTAATSPALIRVLSRVGDINRIFARDAGARTGLLPGVVLTVQNATQVILTPGAVLPPDR